MSRMLFEVACGAALGFVAGCAPTGDPQNASDPPSLTPPAGSAQVIAPPGPALVESRDVAVLVLEQSPASLQVTSSARRPRSSFGPSASWNGAGTPTHRWTLFSAAGEPIASGGIVARSAVEAPPNPAQGAPGARVDLPAFSFTARVPQPAPGEVIEIAALRGSSLSVRWP